MSTEFICKKCRRSEPTHDKRGQPKEWQFCCGQAMAMGIVIGRIVRKKEKP